MSAVLTKHIVDHVVVKNLSFCRELREILRRGEYPGLDLAVIEDIVWTSGHFHRGFDEIYFQLDGKLIVALFDPTNGDKMQTVELAP